MAAIECRPDCGACCIAPSISSAIPGMPLGKPAGVRCVQLDELNRCKIFADPSRPAVCASLKPSVAMCGSESGLLGQAYAMQYLSQLELQTRGS